MDTSAWHILRVASNLEQQISVALFMDNPSLEIYAPTRVFSTFNRRYRIWTPRTSALFPGFMFLKIVDPKDLIRRPNKNVYGFMRVASDGSYMKVLDREIERVRIIEAQLASHEAQRRVKKEATKEVVQEKLVVRSFQELAAIAAKLGMKSQSALAA